MVEDRIPIRNQSPEHREDRRVQGGESGSPLHTCPGPGHDVAAVTTHFHVDHPLSLSAPHHDLTKEFTAMTFPQAPALPEELDKLMRRMRLPYMRKAAPDVLATVRAQRWDLAEVLRLLITEEVTGRDA